MDRERQANITKTNYRNFLYVRHNTPQLLPDGDPVYSGVSPAVN